MRWNMREKMREKGLRFVRGIIHPHSLLHLALSLCWRSSRYGHTWRCEAFHGFNARDTQRENRATEARAPRSEAAYDRGRGEEEGNT
jgi:hypothetical protein